MVYFVMTVLRNYHHTDNYGVFAVRMVFMTLILMLVCGLIIVGPKKMCEFIFDKDSILLSEYF